MALPTVPESAAASVRLEVLEMRAPEGWWAYLAPLAPLPLPLSRRPIYQNTLEALLSRLRGTLANERTVFLELEELHKDDAIREISKNGSLWGPEMGLGVKPEQPSPALWSSKKLRNLKISDPVPPLMLSVMRLDADEEGSAHAMRTMCGTGGLLQVLHSTPAAQLLQAWTEALLPTIEEEALRAFPLYVPLISGETLRLSSAQTLAGCLGNAEVYLRESPEDRGLLVLARRSLEGDLHQSGFRLAGNGR